MRLLYSPTSPYARKVRVAAIEKGLAGDVTLEAASPFGAPDALIPFNPLGKIPALILDDGGVLYDSPVICDYLDSLAPEPRLIPAAGPERWRVLRVQALADGVMDAAFSLVMEARRPPAERSAEWLARWTSAVLRGTAALDGEVAAWGQAFDLGALSAACAAAYVDYRLPQIAWREGAPALGAWCAAAAHRPSLIQTAPPAE